MKKAISFSKLRFMGPVISVLLLVAGVFLTIWVTGINLGIDFEAGVNVRLQISPVAMRVSYEGSEDIELNIRGGVLTLEITGEEETQLLRYPFSEYSTVDSLTQALSSVDGVVVNSLIAGSSETATLLTLNYPYTLAPEPVAINHSVAGSAIAIEEVRSALSSYGEFQIQMIGAPENQEYQIRVPEKPDSRDFDQEVSGTLESLLEAEFGADTVNVRQTDYVGSRLSQNLAQQTVYLAALALVLILVYIWFRFRLAYAISAIAALVHDTAFMFAFVSVTGMEFSTATIAAILTIIGYSLNDTIVIFDRVRENTGLMRNSSILEIADTSITQSLSRTLMTSATTLLAVVALYIFGSGSIRDFALAVIFGVLVGTYSSIFIASPLLMGWIAAASKRKRTKSAQRYGVKVPEGKPAPEDVTEAQPIVREDVDIPMAERKLKGKRKKT